MFNNVEPLRPDTKRKVLEAAKELNYQPNAIAQSFARGKSGNIGVIVPYLPKVHLLSTHYFSEILSGIGVTLGEHNQNLLLMFQSPHVSKDYVQLFRSQKVDGCIILGSKDVPGEREEIEKLHEMGFPYCLINQTFTESSFHSIDAMHYEGSFNAVSHLIQQGFSRIAFLNGPLEYSNSSERLKGYIAALNKAGIAYNQNLVHQGNYSRTSGYQLAASLATKLKEFDAIFAANDRMAIGIIQGLREKGVNAGQDYGIVGYDDTDIASMIQPQLSSVKVPLFEMGQLAAKKLLTDLSKDSIESLQERLPVTLLVRASSQRKN